MSGIYVYLIESGKCSGRRYVGLSREPEKRLLQHNMGQVSATWKHKDWRFVVLIWFNELEKGQRFELYLKHGSGHAFAKRHLW